MSDSDDDVRAEFDEAVNMTAKQLENWLETDESRSVGQKDDGGESTGHRSGRRIISLLGKRKDDLTDDDLAHMKKVQRLREAAPGSASGRRCHRDRLAILLDELGP